MIKRIKKLWKLSRKDPKALEVLESLTPEQLEAVPDEPEEGDGKAVFFGDPTAEEEIEFERKEAGLDKWYNRLKNL